MGPSLSCMHLAVFSYLVYRLTSSSTLRFNVISWELGSHLTVAAKIASGFSFMPLTISELKRFISFLLDDKILYCVQVHQFSDIPASGHFGTTLTKVLCFEQSVVKCGLYNLRISGIKGSMYGIKH
uniref:Uncharacterized protein n=1 Tax=Glossina pallidipes TaxID=7398 RepID=A0A1B0A7U9_GLOPL